METRKRLTISEKLQMLRAYKEKIGFVDAQYKWNSLLEKYERICPENIG